MNILNIRKILGILSFLFLPVTLFYLSPIVIIIGASKGVVCGSFILFATLFILSIIFGRLFCGWLCPVGSFQDWLISIQNKKTKGGKWNLIKYFIWLPWIILIVALFIDAGGINAVQPDLLTKHGWSISETKYFLPYYIVLLSIFLLNFLLGKKAFCHYGCWIAPFMIVGKKIAKLFKLPTLGVQYNPSLCENCDICSNTCPMSIDVLKMVNQNIKLDEDECTLCHQCTESCPKEALKIKFIKK